MRNFIEVNSLGIFSLIILGFLLIQTKNYCIDRDARSRKLWYFSVFWAFTVQFLDIISWALTGVQGEIARIFSYIINTLGYIFVPVLCSKLALFVEYNINFSERAYKFLKRIFDWVIIINSALSILSIPFGFYFKFNEVNIYFRGDFIFICVILSFFPLIFVLLRMIFLYKQESIHLKKIIITGILFPMIFNILQILNVFPIPVLFPSVTLSILLFYLFLIRDSIFIDYLTGLQNKCGANKYFNDLPNFINNYLAVIFIDIDQFKKINDKYGHREGDVALADFAKIILKVARKNDLAARIGGDEFLIAVLINSEDELNLTIERLKNEVDIYNKNSNKPYSLSISYGTSIVSSNTKIDKEKLISEADTMMYKQKNMS